mmetsp:Transcript_27990/g.56423  ORF Transcript_27990/g.56423 Transcript_27990/m.56423 type:complete len:81 (+) Transcript_27990:257-499(+)
MAPVAHFSMTSTDSSRAEHAAGKRAVSSSDTSDGSVNVFPTTTDFPRKEEGDDEGDTDDFEARALDSSILSMPSKTNGSL